MISSCMSQNNTYKLISNKLINKTPQNPPRQSRSSSPFVDLIFETV